MLIYYTVKIFVVDDFELEKRDNFKTTFPACLKKMVHMEMRHFDQ